jgi:hypothetical protein
MDEMVDITSLSHNFCITDKCLFLVWRNKYINGIHEIAGRIGRKVSNLKYNDGKSRKYQLESFCGAIDENETYLLVEKRLK